jgi:hypothetical protein
LPTADSGGISSGGFSVTHQYSRCPQEAIVDIEKQPAVETVAIDDCLDWNALENASTRCARIDHQINDHAVPFSGGRPGLLAKFIDAREVD